MNAASLTGINSVVCVGIRVRMPFRADPRAVRRARALALPVPVLPAPALPVLALPASAGASALRLAWPVSRARTHMGGQSALYLGRVLM